MPSWMGTLKARKGLVAGALLAATVPAAVSLAGGLATGPAHHTSANWALTPAGQQLTLGDFPMNGVLSPDGRYLVVTNDGQSTQSLQVVDLGGEGRTPKVVQTLPYTAPEALYLGLAFSPDGKTLYASAGGNNKIRVYAFAGGTLTEKAPIWLTGNPYPAGLAISPDGVSLYVANNLGNSVSKIDLGKGTVTATAPTGRNPYSAVLSKDGRTLYVSNWGESSVSVLDAATLAPIATVQVGLHPNGMAVNPKSGEVYVSDSDSDQVSVIDPATHQVTRTYALAPYRQAPTGAQPDALTVSADGRTLYVANAGDNDVAVLDLTGGGAAAQAGSASAQAGSASSQANGASAQADAAGAPSEGHAVRGLIPTGWYPTAMLIAPAAPSAPDAPSSSAASSASGAAAPSASAPSSDDALSNPDARSARARLLILNAKGLGSGPNPGYKPGGPPDQYVGSMMQGTLSTVPLPDDAQLAAYTRQVQEDDRFLRAQAEKAASLPIHHVIYVIKENRTYDQVFGDMAKGNGDPSLTEFGAAITPNLHKLAQQFILYDNFYADAEVSAQGHNWATAAKANDYTEKNWLANYSGRNRGYDFEGTNTATYPLAGFLWNNALGHGLTFRDYGEFESQTGPATPQNPNGTWAPDDPSIGNNYCPDCAGWNLQISDLDRYSAWRREFDGFVRNGNLPALEMIRLPNDHTAGTKPGALTPQAYVAQNDYAVGQLVDAVSHSPYWKDTAIFITEDDAQDGPDHVDAHRTEALVISPYTRRGAVDSTYYDTASMVRTMEDILGLPPMTQFDAAAVPMWGGFSTRPNLAPYTAAAPQISLTATNTPSSPMAALSATFDFSKEDRAPMDQLNRVLWAATKGSAPYPAQPATSTTRSDD